MKTNEQIRALEKSLNARTSYRLSADVLRELTLDLHQSLVDAAASGDHLTAINDLLVVES